MYRFGFGFGFDFDQSSRHCIGRSGDIFPTVVNFLFSASCRHFQQLSGYLLAHTYYI